MENTKAVDDAIKSRHAVRGFLSKPVPQKVIKEILDVARFAPSNSNTQPWRVYVVAGERRKALGNAIVAAHQAQPGSHTAQYRHFPEPLHGDFLARQNNFAADYYGTLGIDRTDLAARHAQLGRNFIFFGAPTGLIFTIDRDLEKGSWLDYGMFLQSIMIAARSRGIDSCPQISFAKYHLVIRDHLPIAKREVVVCGMSLGYADPSVKVNDLRMARESLEAFASFFGYENETPLVCNPVSEKIHEQA